MVKEKRTTFHTEAIKEVWNNKRLLYTRLNHLLGKSQTVLPEDTPGQNLGNAFATFFSEKVIKIRNTIEDKLSGIFNNQLQVCSACHCVTKFSSFRKISLSDLSKVFNVMNGKFCSLDPMPTWLLSSCYTEISTVILDIINQSICNGVVPTDFKNATVRPIVKNFKGNADDLSNYRPVSNISFLSKLVEKVVLWQIDDYLNENNLYCVSQSGYRAFYSCETLNLCMFNTILQEMDKGKVVALFLLDMSAAFDTIDHALLIATLRESYGFGGTALKWFETYLNERKFSVHAKHWQSGPAEIEHGVPQGSILGPVLFILYTKHLQHIAQKFDIHIQLYADDTQLYASFDPTKNYESFYLSINSCLEEINFWVTHRFLKLNENKTKFVLLCKPSIEKLIRTNDQPLSITFNNSNITEVNWSKESNVKTLGVHLDPNLNMINHISFLKKFCFGKLAEWKHIRSFLSEETRLLLVKQIILAKLDYNNVLFVGLPKSVLQELQFILNCAIRFIYKLRYHDHITPYLIQAHILPVKYRIDYKYVFLFLTVCINWLLNIYKNYCIGMYQGILWLKVLLVLDPRGQ